MVVGTKREQSHESFGTTFLRSPKCTEFLMCSLFASPPQAPSPEGDARGACGGASAFTTIARVAGRFGQKNRRYTYPS